MCSPHSCSIKITDTSVPRCGTAENGMTDDEALKAGMDEKSKEFVESGAEVYQPA
ncbi:phosphomethylpyrimidine synthase [Prosthecobacter debontii]|uniref:Phosphomethylpyrimidine synthase n=1 Tax=Prosthecobacter debontii TaxID=48467 RepID=A0A1T4XJ03_9BACT|nr:hypothetical protein [Prosthecobacter debontii]SKA89393.1 phosphomethylpyrimidine synthase [Prosthecobacter debontii]